MKAVFGILLMAVFFSCKKKETVYDVFPIVENYNLPLTKTNDNNPILIWSNPNSLIQKKKTAIFYSPHQDDETLGMGASILEHKRIGRNVIVVLLTNGNNPGMLSVLKNIYPKSTMKDVFEARTNEFVAACYALGVDRIYIANEGCGFDESLSKDSLKNCIKNTMLFMEQKFPNSSHKTISGNCDSFNHNCSKMPSHKAASDALHELYESKLVNDVLFYRVYIFYHYINNCDRNVSWKKEIHKEDKSRLINAIYQYKYTDYSMNRYGLGYWHSVRTLFDNLSKSNFEYVDYNSNVY